MQKKYSSLFNILITCILVGFIGYKFYLLPKFNDGEKLPIFSAKLMSGEEFSLSDLKGGYVLLDFWGSWCGPCRRENPALVDLHEKYNNVSFSDGENFTIVSVAIETNKLRWKNAIANDQLNWKHHIVQLDRFEGPIAKAYGVREIPTKYLIDINGKVLMVNPSFEQIHSFLDSKSQ